MRRNNSPERSDWQEPVDAGIRLVQKRGRLGKSAPFRFRRDELRESFGSIQEGKKAVDQEAGLAELILPRAVSPSEYFGSRKDL
jgi:hypothetical protein